MATEFNLAQPWARQPFDTDLSWALFQEYLTLPLPRRFSDLKCGTLTRTQIESLAWEDGWKDRASAWDRHLDELRIATIERVVQEDAKARAERQGRVGKKLQRIAELEADKVLSILERPDMTRGTIEFRDAIRAAAVGVRIERLALGDSTEKIETGPDLSQLSLDDLRKLQELQSKVKEDMTVKDTKE